MVLCHSRLIYLQVPSPALRQKLPDTSSSNTSTSYQRTIYSMSFNILYPNKSTFTRFQARRGTLNVNSISTCCRESGRYDFATQLPEESADAWLSAERVFTPTATWKSSACIYFNITILHLAWTIRSGSTLFILHPIHIT